MPVLYAACAIRVDRSPGSDQTMADDPTEAVVAMAAKAAADAAAALVRPPPEVETLGSGRADSDAGQVSFCSGVNSGPTEDARRRGYLRSADDAADSSDVPDHRHERDSVARQVLKLVYQRGCNSVARQVAVVANGRRFSVARCEPPRHPWPGTSVAR